MFNYDWFHGEAFHQQIHEAKWCCALQHFPDVDPEQENESENEKVMAFYEELEHRTLLYLRDGFSYEMKRIADVHSKSHLVFECAPVDEHYKVGCFVVTVPFEEVVRVEVYAVHPSEKPEDLPQITGFRSPAEPGEKPHSDRAMAPTKPAR